LRRIAVAPGSCPVGARVIVTLEIEAELPVGVPEAVVRAVSANCRTLRSRSHGFEED
jgi:hypothetical protein